MTMKVGGKLQSQLAESLGTSDRPRATFHLVHPMVLSPGLSSGATITASATGKLTMGRATHLVTFRFSARRKGAVLLLAGSAPIALADWGARPPTGLGPVASVADHGMAELLLVLDRP
jgi:hypothetical protein